MTPHPALSPKRGEGKQKVISLIEKAYAPTGGDMKKYICDVCGYVYDPAEGDPDNDVAPGTAFEKLPEGWVCPVCGAGKDQFSPAS